MRGKLHYLFIIFALIFVSYLSFALGQKYYKSTTGGVNTTSYYKYQGSLSGQEFRGLPEPRFFADKPYYGDPVDIDNDGTKEITFYTLEAMNKTPHRAYIVKNNKIIFESESKPRVKLEETENLEGFYLSEYTEQTVDNKIEEARKYTKYALVNDKFSPVDEVFYPNSSCPISYLSTLNKQPDYIKNNKYVMSLLTKECYIVVDSFLHDVDSDNQNEIFLRTSKITCGTASCKTRELYIVDGSDDIFYTEGYDSYFRKTAKQNEFDVVEQIKYWNEQPCCSSKNLAIKYTYNKEEPTKFVPTKTTIENNPSYNQ